MFHVCPLLFRERMDPGAGVGGSGSGGGGGENRSSQLRPVYRYIFSCPGQAQALVRELSRRAALVSVPCARCLWVPLLLSWSRAREYLFGQVTIILFDSRGKKWRRSVRSIPSDAAVSCAQC